MDTSRKKPDGMEKDFEDKLSKLEESVLGKLQKASTRALNKSMKDAGAACTSVCPECLSFCGKDLGHYYSHHCGYCGNSWT